jgi:cytochrome c2
MPSSLKLVALLLSLGFVSAIATLVVQRHENKQRDEEVAAALTGGDPHAGKAAIIRYGCGACHAIPAVSRANGQVGPSLDKIGVRAVIAGRLPNRPDQMVAWIRFPQSASPGTAMPDMGVSEKDGRDIAAYLYTLR